jgi:hypothetical protein
VISPRPSLVEKKLRIKLLSSWHALLFPINSVVHYGLVQMALVMAFSLTEVLAGHLTFEMYVALDKALVSKLVYSTLT